MKTDLFLLKYGELALKGLNKPVFEKKLLDNIKARLKKIGSFNVFAAQSTIYVEPQGEVDMEDTLKSLKKVFGIANICPAVRCAKTLDEIEKTAVECLSEEELEGKTFKVEAKREDKSFPLNSPQLAAEMGGRILSHYPRLKVDVHNPDILVQVEIRKDAYVYMKKIKGAGGMPIGTNGKATILLSGGIDSPVAGYMIAKRGVRLEAVHFHSHPYTSDRAKEKVIELAKIMTEYCGNMRVHVIPFTDIQLEIIDKCPKILLTVIMRRMMMRIAEMIAEKTRGQALITGESIGQVASQTMESLNATNSVVSMPVFRPLIGMDKEEIVKISKEIGTYETSILPFEDCCTIFVPKHPKTKPTIEELIEAEKLLPEFEKMLEAAVNNEEVIQVGN
ncbi:MAG: tRNA 4-thiouridine(8) synthase ThiI [Ruminococcaceae bacterium]|nr:tRNA 4-thiouridine(8) synthase ThiI [Oscillospiraceae bacterium]